MANRGQTSAVSGQARGELDGCWTTKDCWLAFTSMASGQCGTTRPLSRSSLRARRAQRLAGVGDSTHLFLSYHPAWTLSLSLFSLVTLHSETCILSFISSSLPPPLFCFILLYSLSPDTSARDAIVCQSTLIHS